MTSKIKDEIFKCNSCLKYRNRNQKQPLMLYKIPNLPWQNIASDIFKYERNIYLLAKDDYSKFIETWRIKDKHASPVQPSNPSFFVRHGIPHTFMADNIPYNSHEFKSFSNQCNFILKTSCPNYSESNGLSKMGVKIVKQMSTLNEPINIIYTTSAQQHLKTCNTKECQKNLSQKQKQKSYYRP